MRRESGKPSAASARSYTAAAWGERSTRSAPIPTYCEPCPGKTKAWDRGATAPAASVWCGIRIVLGMLCGSIARATLVRSAGDLRPHRVPLDHVSQDRQAECQCAHRHALVVAVVERQERRLRV